MCYNVKATLIESAVFHVVRAERNRIEKIVPVSGRKLSLTRDHSNESKRVDITAQEVQ
jgi:hypothetical protein